MSVRYIAVNWNRQKRIYDLTLIAAVIGLVALFAGVTAVAHPDATIETMLIRVLGFTAILLLVVILSIGPASRLDRRFLPLLYNRRHLGVTLAILALAHAGFAIVQYYTAGTLNPFVSLLTSSGRYEFSLRFPFELFGLAALVVFGCDLCPGIESPPPHVPALFQAYLSLGAKVISPPAIDRDFKTIDWLVMLDVRTIDPATYRFFFRDPSEL